MSKQQKILITYLDSVLEFESISKLEDQVTIRRELIDKMVGQLYPSILEDEISKINNRIWELKH